MMRDNAGLSINKTNTNGPYEAKDKTGAHSIAALNRFICDSKNGATYSDNIKASIGEKPDPVNPYLPNKYATRPLPTEKFGAQNRQSGGGCSCGIRRRPTYIIEGTPVEKFCGCDTVFMERAPEILSYGPIALIVLILFAAILISKIVICRLRNATVTSTATPQTMNGGVIDENFDSII